MNNKIFSNLNYTKFLNYISLFLLSLIFHFNSLAEDKSIPKELEGYQVNFDYTGNPVEREIAYQFYNNYFKIYEDDEPLKHDEIGIDLYDIDDDGEKEILTYLDKEGYCGMLGCSFKILKLNKKDNKYYNISWIDSNDKKFDLIVGDNIKILKTCTLNFHDLAFFRFENDPAIWKWNGKGYDIAKQSTKKLLN